MSEAKGYEPNNADNDAIQQGVKLEGGIAVGSHSREINVDGVDYLISVGASMDHIGRLVPSVMITPYLEGTKDPDIGKMRVKNVLLRQHDESGKAKTVMLEQKEENLQTFNELCEEILGQVERGMQTSGIEATLAAYDR